MISKIIRYLSAFIILITLSACPMMDDFEDDCTQVVNVDNLLTLTPFRTSYNQGEIITLKLVIQSTNNYFGNQMDLNNMINNGNSQLQFYSDSLFVDNEITFIKGSEIIYENSRFNLIYNSNSNSYEFEIQIKLNKTGVYSFESAENILFSKENNGCKRYQISTNIEGMNSEGNIEFYVQ